MLNIEIKRLVRTASSESYVFFEDGDRIAVLDLHILNCVHGCLIIEKKLQDDDLKFLIEKIDDVIIPYPREDFILSVYFGEEIGFYSDNISAEDRLYEPAKTKDIQHISDLIAKALGRGQEAKGKLTEFVVIEFLNGIGYKTEKAGQELDHKKIDLIAVNDEGKMYVQVKSGKIADQEIRNVVKSVAESFSNGKAAVAIVAKEFSATSEKLRFSLQQEFGINVIYFHGYQILNELPQYKHAIS